MMSWPVMKLFIVIVTTFVILSTPALRAANRDGQLGVPEGEGTAVSAVRFSSEPQLVSEGAIKLPLLRLIKKGVDGTVSVDVDIDRRGNVVRCFVVEGVDELLDSLVCESMMLSRFSPAYNEGVSVDATVNVRYTFDHEAILRNSGNVSPEIRGIVIEGEAGVPVRNARVNLQVIDPAADPDLEVPLKDYMTRIGAVAGQEEWNGFLTTKTDSLGRFSFRFVPAGRVRLAVSAKGNEIFHGELAVKPEITKNIVCRMESLPKDTIPEIVVYGRTDRDKIIDIEEEQIEEGLTHYISDLLSRETRVHAVPESRSKMMIRAGSPYDNRYYICGIPFLAPFHFGGHPYMDIDGMMISSLSDIGLTIDGIAGKQLDASGMRLDAQPGIYRPADRKLLEVPELSVDYNTIGQDILFSVPGKKSDACLQLGFTRAENHTLSFFDSWNQFEENEYGSPSSYGNVTLTAYASSNTWNINGFSWLAWDLYKEEGPILWGMGSVVLEPKSGKAPLILAGGSHQYFAAGNRVGFHTYRTRSELTSGTVNCRFDSLLSFFDNSSVAIRAEGLRWNGALLIETIFERVRPTVFRDTVDYVYTSVPDNDEFTIETHGTVGKSFGKFTAVVDLLAATVIYGKTPDFVGDGGVSISWQTDPVQLSLNCGRITSRPDIRGLPDSHYRRLKNSTYLVSLPLQLRPLSTIRFGVQPYMRWKKHEPQLDPIALVWDPQRATPLRAIGADIDADYRIFDWLSITGALNVSKAQRYDDGVYVPYEWDVPWSGRGGLHAMFGNESWMHFYLNGTVSRGMFYYHVNKEKNVRFENYQRIDFSAQYRSRFIEHRFLTRYDAYFNIFNLTDFFNVRSYYWNEEMVPVEILQGGMMCEMGLRMGFRVPARREWRRKNRRSV